jgi:hypothetical protein
MDLVFETDGWQVQEPWVQSAADIFAWAVLSGGLVITMVALLVLVLVTRVVRRRRFWCAPANRDVEVEFEERGLLGFRRRTAVLSCSAFECPGEISCRRHCLSAEGQVRLPMNPPYWIRLS